MNGVRVAKITLAILASATLAAATSAAPARKAAAPSLFGTWQNPSGSVRIKTSKCGSTVCGAVVYANDKARADAAKGGTTKLIGLNLFQEFAATSSDTWEGKVMVPDLDRTVGGKITLIDAKTMKVEGCLFGHIACKDQIWTKQR